MSGPKEAENAAEKDAGEYCAAIAANRREADVRTAAKALVARIEEIHENPLFKAAWWVANIHGVDYTHGPKYDKELAALKDALNLP